MNANETNRSATPLIFGVALVALGALFLAARFIDWDINFFGWVRFVLPALFIAWGASKLVRHFSWTKEKLASQPYRASLLSGLFWTTIGVLWVLDLLEVIRAFEFFGLYWPLLLVLFGLGKIIDYYRLSGQMQFRFGEVFGVIFVIFFGLLSGVAADAHFPLVLPSWIDDEDVLADFAGNRYRWDVRDSMAAEGLESVTIDNIYGDIRVIASESDTVAVRLTKEVFDRNEASARSFSDQVEMRLTKDGSTARITTNRGDLDVKRGRFRSHFEITVPSNLAVNVNNQHGQVRISNLEADCTVVNAYGEVSANQITGNVNIRNRYRSASARQITGNVNILNRRGTITAEDVTGQTELATEYDSIRASRVGGELTITNRYGRVILNSVSSAINVDAPGSEVSVTDADQNVKIQNSHKPVRLRSIEGSVELDTSSSRVELIGVSGEAVVRAAHSSITGRDLTGGTTVVGQGSRVALTDVDGGFIVKTSLRDVTVRGFSGPGEVLTEYGEITLSTDEPVEEALAATNKQGPISVTLPSRSSFRLVAQSAGGQVRSDFGDSRSPSAVVETNVGSGGPEVRLETTHAQIRIRKAN